MPTYYKVYNCFPSFTSTFELDGTTRTNPLPSYDGLGDHLEDYFVNRMAETPAGGYDNLVAFLASQKSLTGIVAADLTGMANNLSVKFGITGSTEGYALLDFRGDSWKYLIGDGIVGPSNTTNIPAYTNTLNAAVSILTHFKNRYPLVKWAFAGLPHLPQYTTFAPTNGTGTAFAWDTSLTNSAGATNNHWDPQHPTGGDYGTAFFNWYHTPSDLRLFHYNKALSRCSAVLDAAGWACPDINPVVTEESKFGTFVHSIESQNNYASDLTRLTDSYASEQRRQFKVMPLVSSVLRSRTEHQFDDTGASAGFDSVGFNYGVSGQVVTTYSGYTGASANASDCPMSISILRAGILEPAARNGAVGFVYQDNFPLLIELACTGATQSSETARQAVERARNFVGDKVYGTTDISLLPWSSLKSELKSYISQNIIAPQLRAFSETLPIGETFMRSLIAGNHAVQGGVSKNIGEYDSVAWSQTSFINTDGSVSNQTSTNQSSVVECQCPQPPTGACCKDGTCSDGVRQADCNGTWSQDTPCSSLSSNPECKPQNVLCCENGNCTTKPSDQCGGRAVDDCAECPCGSGSNPTDCICVRECTTDCTTGDGTVVQKHCKAYDIGPGACCCQPGVGTPSGCSGIRQGLNCDCVPDGPPPFGGSNCCPGQCADDIQVSPALASCCGVAGCQDAWASACPNTGCCTVSDGCTPVSELLADPNVSNSLKMSVIHDLTTYFGITLTDAEIANYTQNTAFRNSQTVSNTLAYYTSLGQNETFAYINLIANYRPTTLTVSRIKSEFAFDRMLLPIEYT